MKFNPYIEPFEKFKQNIIQTLIDTMEDFENDLCEDGFRAKMYAYVFYYFNTENMEIWKDEEIDNILENKADRLLEMLQYIKYFNDEYFGTIKIVYDKDKIVNHFRYSYGYINQPTYQDYLEFKTLKR